MKTLITFIMISVLSFPGTSQVEIATFPISDFYFSTSILCIDNPDLSKKKSPLEKENSKNEDLYSEIIPWITIVGMFTFVFFSCKHAYLSLQSIEYEKFYDDMNAYYLKHGYHQKVYQLQYIDSWKYFFNLKVWKLTDLLDPFTQEDFKKWSKDNSWRPEIAHYKYL